MGCGCGKKVSRPAGSAQTVQRTVVPAMVQKATYASKPTTVQSQATPYRQGMTITRRVV
jgi:hypothetical protein